MEDYEAQEQEFWRKLHEMDMSRSQMLKRSFAAAAGLTILSSPGVALAARRAGEASPPRKTQNMSSLNFGSWPVPSRTSRLTM